MKVPRHKSTEEDTSLTRKHVAERNRRARINYYLEEIEKLITPASGIQNHTPGKLEKAEVLERTVMYLKQHSVSQLNCQQSYIRGFLECIRSIQSLIVTMNISESDVRHIFRGCLSSVKRSLHKQNHDNTKRVNLKSKYVNGHHSASKALHSTQTLTSSSHSNKELVAENVQNPNIQGRQLLEGCNSRLSVRAIENRRQILMNSPCLPFESKSNNKENMLSRNKNSVFGLKDLTNLPEKTRDVDIKLEYLEDKRKGNETYTPYVINNDMPMAYDINTPMADDIDTPMVDDTDTPIVDDINTPMVNNIDCDDPMWRPW